MSHTVLRWADLPPAAKSLTAGQLAARIDQHIEVRWSKPDQPETRARLARLVADLGSDQFDVRREAREALERFGEAAAPALREKLADKPGLEVRQQLDRLLAKVRAPAEDAEFFRRLSLDLNGRIPTITQIKDYLDDPRLDRQRLWAQECIHGRDNADLYCKHWTNHWRNTLLAHAEPARRTGEHFAFDRWLGRHIRNNTPFDRFVRDLLTNPLAKDFYAAYEYRPEQIAYVVARAFLGLRREWPAYDDDASAGTWTRTQFWQFATFFAPVTEGGQGPAEITRPDGTAVRARFPDGTEPRLKRGDSTLEVLADWLTRAGNPYFARNAVNRLWAYFFGTGLIEPVDGGGPDNPPSHPELLDELAQQFVAHEFDLQYLFQAITGSDAYQRTSVRSSAGPDDPRRFVRMAVRRLTAEQLWDSLAEAVGGPPEGAVGLKTARAEFMRTFGNEPGTAGVSVQQALQLMNGKATAAATSLDKSRSLRTIANAGAQISTARRVDELYFVALSRPPKPAELAKLVQYVDSGGAARDPRKALADIFWALLNSSEFLVNH